VALADAGRGLDHEHARALGAVALPDGGAEGLEQARLRGAGLGTGREVGEEVGRHRNMKVPAIRVLGYPFRATIMKRRNRDAGLQA